MAGNRPARTIKPPNKFLDNDLQIASSTNGLSNHADSSNVIIGAARKLSRSASLTKEEAKNVPKRRASSTETSAEEDNNRVIRTSRQNSLSPSAKLKLPRKSEGDTVPGVNGEHGRSVKEPVTSAKINSVIGKAKPIMAARKSASETPKYSPSKTNATNSDVSVLDTNTGRNEVTESDGKGKTKVKVAEKVEETVKESENEAITQTDPPLKKRGKPGPKPNVNTKKLKSVYVRIKGVISKTPKATAERVKRKYAYKKGTTTVSESKAVASGSSKADVVSSVKPEITSKVGTAKKKTLKVAKLSTKPGKRKLVSKFKKGPNPSRLKKSGLEQDTLVTKRPRLKPGPKPKRLKLEKNVSAVNEVSEENSEYTVRYKLDGSPCLKPGPKPKKLDSTVAENTSPQTIVSPQSLDKTVLSNKGKPGPKPKKSLNDGSENLMNTKNHGKLSEAKDEKTALSPKGKSSPKSKVPADSQGAVARKKPGPKPKRSVGQGAEIISSHVEPAAVPVSPPVRNKSGPKPRKKVPETVGENSENSVRIDTKSNQKQSSSSVHETQAARAKPGPKPKKIHSDTSIVDSPENSKKKSNVKLKKGLSENMGAASKSKTELQAVVTESQTLAKSDTKGKQTNVTDSPTGSKLPSKGKSTRSEKNITPAKTKPGPKAKKALLQGNKPSPNKLTNKKKGAKRKANSSTAERQDSTSDESDTLYSLADHERKKFKLDGNDSATSSDSEVVLRKPSKASPSPRKMLLMDSIRPKNIGNETCKTDSDKAGSSSQDKSPSKSAPPGVFKKMAAVTTPGSSQGLQPHGTETESKLGVYMKDLPTMPVIPNMMPTSPLAASHKNLLKTLNQSKVVAGRSKRQPSNSSDEEESIVERRVSVRQSESAFKYKEIVVKKCPGYTQIWLFTSTKIKNSLNPKVFQELKEALKNARYDDSKLVMLSGSGSVFCSGIDLHYLMDDDRRMAAKKMSDAMKEFVLAVVSFPKPIVAAVNGAAIGLGVAILPLCDIIYASDKASFSCPYSRLAQTPEGCATHTFPSVMGMAMANELLLGGRKLTAIEAYQIGLVSQVFWPTSMMQEVIPRIQNMASFSSRALEQSKLLMRSASRTKLDYAIEAECQILLERWSSAECHRAFRTYLEEEQDLLV